MKEEPETAMSTGGYSPVGDSWPVVACVRRHSGRKNLLAVDFGETITTTAIETWPTRLPDQVVLVKKLIPQHGPDPVALSAAFGKANKKRHEQIEGILETLRGLGLL